MAILLGPLAMLLLALAIAYVVIKFIKRNHKTWAVKSKNDDLVATQRAHANANLKDKALADQQDNDITEFLH